MSRHDPQLNKLYESTYRKYLFLDKTSEQCTSIVKNTLWKDNKKCCVIFQFSAWILFVQYTVDIKLQHNASHASFIEQSICFMAAKWKQFDAGDSVGYHIALSEGSLLMYLASLIFNKWVWPACSCKGCWELLDTSLHINDSSTIPDVLRGIQCAVQNL